MTRSSWKVFAVAGLQETCKHQVFLKEQKVCNLGDFTIYIYIYISGHLFPLAQAKDSASVTGVVPVNKHKERGSLLVPELSGGG